MKYPIGIQNFESLRKDGYAYVDKTERIYQLADTGRYYFLSRPRRFGKSLLISTMHAYFSGQRELFKGLAIEQLEHDWVVRPVLHLDLNTGKYDCLESLTNQLNLALLEWERLYGKGEGEIMPNERFWGVVRRAYEKTGHRVAILVDEYDKPLLQSIGNEKLQDEFRSTLKAFYSVVKTQDRYIKFGFFTGVTKFSKVSVFSDLNNLQDISMDDRYVDICGLTEDEIVANFDEGIGELAAASKMTKDECREMLRRRYDGYHFAEDTVGMYNPFSVLNTLAKRKFGSYWFETGTPSFLVELLKNSKYDLSRLATEQVSAKVLDSIDSLFSNPIPVIYQSGYLTIKSYEPEFKLYTLGFPNEEVEHGFMQYLLPLYTPIPEDEGDFAISQFVMDVRNGEIESFLDRLKAIFADTDYKIVGEAEKYFQNALYLIFKMMGFYVQVERPTSRGRMDAVIQTADYIYIIECKLDRTAEEALAQIDERGYAEPFALDNRTLYKIGVNFSSGTRGVESVLYAKR